MTNPAGTLRVVSHVMSIVSRPCAPRRRPRPSGARAAGVVASVFVVSAALLAAVAPRLAAQPSPAAAPPPPPPPPTAPHALGAVWLPGATPQIDGRLDEPAWRRAPAATDFVQRAPRAGAPASHRTEVRVLYDRNALYVGVRAFDPEPGRIGRQLARRDPDGIYSDWIHVGIDSFRDRRTGFRFSVNPRGVQGDGYLFNDVDEDALWDAVWTSAAHVDSLGWTAELRIPLSQLRFSQADATGAGALPPGSWGFNVVREIARLGEESWWAPTPPDQPGVVSRFGTLTGLDSLGAPSALELIPYVRTQATRAPVERGNPFSSPTEGGAAAGLDVRWRLPRNLTLSATVNPDFGQVEADPAVVNLTQFEVFFPERRPFFLEGADAFQFGNTVTFNGDDAPSFFYTRRIGRAPARRIGGAGTRFVDAPVFTGIVGAAKVSGKTPGGWSVGAMAAATRPERARVLDTAGVIARVPVEPTGGYGIARVRRDFRGGNTVVGAIGTLAARSADDVFAPLLAGSSGVAGVDFEHAWQQRTWTVSGVLAGSRVSGDRTFLTRLQQAPYRVFARPDAGHLVLDSARVALGGHFGALSFAKTAGRHWVGSATYEETSPGFEVNDLGFQQRADKRALSTALFYRSLRQGTRGLARRFRSYELGTFTTGARNFAGDLLALRTAFNADAQLDNFWELNLFATRSAPALDDRLTRGGPLARLPARWRVTGSVDSDQRRAAIFGVELGADGDAAGRWGRSVGVSADLRPTSALRLRLEPQYARGRAVDQYVTTYDDPTATGTFGRRHVFGRIRREEVNLTTRVDWTFSPTLSFQLFAQPFAAAGRYTGFASFERPGAFAFRELPTVRGDGRVRLDPDGPGGAREAVLAEPDFLVRSLRGNAVMRWEYRPGSAVFLVWQQQREVARDGGSLGPLDRVSLRDDVGRVFGDRGTHVFLVKVSHWLGR